MDDEKFETETPIDNQPPTEEELAWAALARQRAKTRNIRPPKKDS